MDSWSTTFIDDWHAGERHLHYTLIAVAIVLVLGVVVVPTSASSRNIDTVPRSTLLAERYVEAARKIEGVRSVPGVAEVARRYGTTGGRSCEASNRALHASVSSGRRLDDIAHERLRTRLRTYCPAVDERYGSWLRARGVETGIHAR